VEWVVVGLLVIAGGLLRCAFPDRMMVEHFDEGVYASNIWFGPDDGFRYPQQHLYAPPLLPTLIEWIFSLAGPSNLGAMIPGLATGCLTVPVVWWVGRAWFGPIAGVAAAALAALADHHAAFSRTALTDVPLCFWLILGVHFTWRGLVHGHVWTLLGGSLCTGLAWWTKYNGWLPIAITGSGLAAWLIHRRLVPAEGAAGPSTIRLLGRWVAFALLAGAIWSPWIWSLQEHGGYAAVAANHRTYLVGWSGWWNSATQYAARIAELIGTSGAHAFPVAIAASLGVAVWSMRCFTWNAFAATLGSAPLLGVGAFALVLVVPTLLGPVPFALIAGGLGILAWHATHWREGGTARSLAAWFLTAWFVGLTLSTPCYTPYPRLPLPWLLATWLGTGLLIQQAVEHFAQRIQTGDATPATSKSILRWMAIAGALLAVLSGAELHLLPWRMPVWEYRAGAYTAGSMAQFLPTMLYVRGQRRAPYVIYTLSDPAVLFQMRLAGAEHVRPVSTLALGRPEAPTPRILSFVFIGRQALAGGFAERQLEGATRLVQINSLEARPSRLVTLDDPDWNDPARKSRDKLQLFEIR
jgi:hypothetical protein